MQRPDYHIDIFWSDEDGGYIANVPDLKYCSAFGETYEEAEREVQVAIDLHLDVLRERGRPVPEPGTASREGLRTRPKVEPSRLVGVPEEQQQQRLNEAAQQFTEALAQSFRAVSDRTAGAQEQGAQLTQEFFDRVVENLRAQTEDTRQMDQQLAHQQQRATEAGQTLTEATVDAYMEFVNSMFTFWQGSAEASRRGTTEAGR